MDLIKNIKTLIGLFLVTLGVGVYASFLPVLLLFCNIYVQCIIAVPLWFLARRILGPQILGGCLSLNPERVAKSKMASVVAIIMGTVTFLIVELVYLSGFGLDWDFLIPGIFLVMMYWQLDSLMVCYIWMLNRGDEGL